MTNKKLIVAVLLAVLLAGCAAGTGDSSSPPNNAGSATDNAAGDLSQGSFFDRDQRMIIREAEMDIEVDDYETSYQNIRTVARDNGGFVGDRSRNSDGDWSAGYVVIHIPAENFGKTRDDISAIGEVRSESVNRKDFTAQHQNLGRRLAQLERDEARLEEMLAETEGTDEALTVRNEIESVRNEMRQIEGQQSGIETREALSTIRVDLQEPISEKPPKNYESAFGFTDAFLGAFYGGLEVVKYVIVIFGYLIPTGLTLVAFAAITKILLKVGWIVDHFTTNAMDRLHVALLGELPDRDSVEEEAGD